MDTKFNLYDLFGVLIPGGVLCIAFYYFFRGVGYTAGLESGWAQAVLLLPVAYSAGTLVHHAARKFISIRDHSLKLLTAEDTEFGALFTEKLFNKAMQVFDLAPTPQEPDTNEFRQQLFKLCYDYVIQNNKGVYVENFNAYYAMCRSMMIVSCASGLLASVWIWKLDKNPLWIILIVVATAVATKAFYEGFESNARNFAVSVYRSFYIATVSTPPNTSLKGL